MCRSMVRCCARPSASSLMCHYAGVPVRGYDMFVKVPAVGAGLFLCGGSRALGRYGDAAVDAGHAGRRDADRADAGHASARDPAAQNAGFAGLGFLPRPLRAPLVNKFLIAEQLHGVRQDQVIWGRKRYLSRPRLCRSDGEIMAFRAYCAQFYPDPDGCQGGTD